MDNYDKAEDFVHHMHKISDLIDDYANLRRKIDDMPNIHIEDRDNMFCILWQLTGFQNLYFACADFLLLMFEMENEKDQFSVQSAAHHHFQTLRRETDTLIDVADTWEMDNFRCQNFMRQMKSTFVETKHIIDTIDFV